MPQERNDSKRSENNQATNIAGDTTQNAANFVQNAVGNVTEAAGNLVDRTVNGTQNLVKQVTGNNNNNDKTQ